MSAFGVGLIMNENQPPEQRGSDKRPRGSPTGHTPLQEKKKSASVQHKVSKGRRQLMFAWSDMEQGALVEFILLHKPSQTWPADQDH